MKNKQQKPAVPSVENIYLFGEVDICVTMVVWGLEQFWACLLRE